MPSFSGFDQLVLLTWMMVGGEYYGIPACSYVSLRMIVGWGDYGKSWYYIASVEAVGKHRELVKGLLYYWRLGPHVFPQPIHCISVQFPMIPHEYLYIRTVPDVSPCICPFGYM